MGDERLAEESIYDIKFTYNSKPVGYTTSMSHMNGLYEIAHKKHNKKHKMYNLCAPYLKSSKQM